MLFTTWINPVFMLRQALPLNEFYHLEASILSCLKKVLLCMNFFKCFSYWCGDYHIGFAVYASGCFIEYCDIFTSECLDKTRRGINGKGGATY